MPASIPLGDPATRIAVASLVTPAGGAIASLAAAWVHGHLVLPFPARIVVAVPAGRRRRDRAGVRFVESDADSADISDLHTVAVTSPLRTAYDIAREVLYADAVVQLDALCHARLITPAALSRYTDNHGGARHVGRARRAISAIEPKTESPMETRLRLLLIAHGLPAPVAQHVVHDDDGTVIARLDLAYPDERLGIEYDGGHHRDRDVFVSDAERGNRLAGRHWTLLHFTAFDVFRRAPIVAARVRALLK